VAPLRSRATTLGREARAFWPGRRAGPAWPGQAAAAPLERFEDESLIGFDDARKALGLVEVEGGEKPMPPSEGGARVNLASFGRLGEALPFDQGLHLIEPAVLVVQAGDGTSRERIA
jgi:hypothetical protein